MIPDTVRTGGNDLRLLGGGSSQGIFIVGHSVEDLPQRQSDDS